MCLLINWAALRVDLVFVVTCLYLHTDFRRLNARFQIDLCYLKTPWTVTENKLLKTTSPSNINGPDHVKKFWRHGIQIGARLQAPPIITLMYRFLVFV
jgi:hypothetical protein